MTERQRQARLRAQAADEGRCIRCRRRAPRKGKKTCEACLAEISALVALRRARLQPPIESRSVRRVIAMADADPAFRETLIRRVLRKTERSAWPARRREALAALPTLPQDVQRIIRRWARRSPTGGVLSTESPLYVQQLVVGVETYWRWCAIASVSTSAAGAVGPRRRRRRTVVSKSHQR